MKDLARALQSTRKDEVRSLKSIKGAWISMEIVGVGWILEGNGGKKGKVGSETGSDVMRVGIDGDQEGGCSARSEPTALGKALGDVR